MIQVENGFGKIFTENFLRILGKLYGSFSGNLATFEKKKKKCGFSLVWKDPCKGAQAFT